MPFVNAMLLTVASAEREWGDWDEVYLASVSRWSAPPWSSATSPFRSNGRVTWHTHPASATEHSKRGPWPRRSGSPWMTRQP